MLCVCLWRWFRSTAAKLGTSFGKFKVMKDAQNHGKRIRLKRGPESILYLFQAAKKVSASNLSSGESFSASRALIEIWRSRKKKLSAQQVWKSSSLHSYVPKLFSHSSSKDLLPLKNVVVWHLSSPTFSYFCDCMPPTFFAFMHLYKYTFWKWPFHCFHYASLLCSIYYLV